MVTASPVFNTVASAFGWGLIRSRAAFAGNSDFVGRTVSATKGKHEKIVNGADWLRVLR
jgi:hypothetical protein